MNKSRIQTLLLCIVSMCICLLFSACSSITSYSNAAMDSLPSDHVESSDGNSVPFEFIASGAISDTETPTKSESSSIYNADSVGPEEDIPVPDDKATLKIIKEGSLSLQTKNIDDFDASLADSISKMNGFLADSRISGSIGERTARYTCRIPVENFDSFFKIVPGDATVIDRSVSSTDVTEQYTDLEMRLETNRTKHDRLLELLDKAESLTDIYSIQSEISDVEYEIESIEGQLKSMDSQITYSTVDIYVEETSTPTAVAEDSSFFSKLLAALDNGINNFMNACGHFILFVANHFLFFALISATASFISAKIKSIRKKKEKKEKDPKSSEKE